MDWTSDNLAEAFRLFEQRLQLFFKVKKVREADQVPHILPQVGEEGLRRFNSWTLTEEEEADPAIILQKFKEQLEPAENFRVSRLRKDESLDDFVNRAKLQAHKSDFSADEINERLLELTRPRLSKKPAQQGKGIHSRRRPEVRPYIRGNSSSCQRLKGHADLSVGRDHQVPGLQQLWNKTRSDEMPSVWKQLRSLWKGQPLGQSMPFIR